jgi:hypothetical protein
VSSQSRPCTIQMNCLRWQSQERLDGIVLVCEAWRVNRRLLFRLRLLEWTRREGRQAPSHRCVAPLKAPEHVRENPVQHQTHLRHQVKFQMTSIARSSRTTIHILHSPLNPDSPKTHLSSLKCHRPVTPPGSSVPRPNRRRTTLTAQSTSTS